MLLGIAFLLIQILFGLSLFGYFDPKNKFSPWEFFIASLSAGIIGSSFLILALSLILKTLYLALIFFSIIAVLVIIFRLRELKKIFLSTIKTANNFRLRTIIKPWFFILLLIIFVYVLTVSTVLIRDETGSLQSIMIAWGDTALHISLIERFAVAEPFQLTHPILGGTNLVYPFLIDFISSIYLKLGGDLVFAFRLPLYVLGIIWILLIFCIASRVLQSRLFATIVLILVIFGSGFGFTVLYKDLKHGYDAGGFEGLISAIKDPPHEYTHLDNRTGGKTKEKETEDNIVWIVPINNPLVHQRSFTAGLAIFSIIILGLFYYGREKYFWRFGLFAGFLPFAHGHTFLATFIILAVLFWFYVKNWKYWITFALLVLVVALPQIALFYSSNIVNTSAFKPYFGWMTCEHNISWFFCDPQSTLNSNPLFFWSNNFGIIFIIWLLFTAFVLTAFFLPRIWTVLESKIDLKYIIASFLLFLIPNLILFQPWPFDNNKVLFYWWLLAIIFVVTPALKMIWERRYYGKVAVIVLIIFSILSGGFDSFARITNPKDRYYYGYTDGLKENIEMGDWIRNNTLPNDLFLTNTNIDTIPLFLAGRPVYIGYGGWLWSHGLNYSDNEKNSRVILGGQVSVACIEKIKYIILDQSLKNTFPGTQAEVLLSKTEKVFEQQVYGMRRYILKIKCDNS